MKRLCADYQAELSEQKLKEKVRKNAENLTPGRAACHKKLNFNSKPPKPASDETWNKEITQFLKSWKF